MSIKTTNKKNDDTVVSKKHQQMIQDTLSKNPGESLYEPLFSEYVEIFLTPDPSKKTKLVNAILVVTRFRVYIFPKGKQLDRDLPILFLIEINGKQKAATIKFNVPGKGVTYLIVNHDHHIPRIVYTIRDSYRKISYGVPKSKSYSCAFEGADDLPEDFNPGPALGFIASYEAYCNLYGTPIREDVIEYVKDLDNAGITDFNLTACPGIDLKSEISFEVLPLASALKNNTYWRGLEVRDVEHKEVATAIATVLTENRVLSRVVCSNCASDVTDALGQAIAQNNYHKISVLDLSGNRFGLKAVDTLAYAFQICPHTMEVVNLSDIGMTSQGLSSLINAWSINWGLTLSIEELNISNNPVGTSSTEYVQFMSNMRRHSKLKRLALANTGIAVGSLILELGFLKLTFLDLSDNKFDKITQNNLVHFCEATKTLETIRLANTDLGAAIIAKLLRSLFENESISTLSVDISRNNLGTVGVSTLAPSLKIATFNAFDVSDNGIRTKGAIELLANIKSVQRLILDRNWGKEEKEEEALAKALGAFLGSHPALYHLSLVGTSGNRLGRALKTFFNLLPGNHYLEELDYSGNAVGDSVFSAFSFALPLCSLKAIRCSGNDLTLAALMTLNRALPKTSHLLQFDFPLEDFEATESRLKPKYLEIGLEIIKTLSKRTDGRPVWRINPFIFDTKWASPLNINPLHGVPPELSTISSKLHTGPLPILPNDEPLPLSPLSSNRYEDERKRSRLGSPSIKPSSSQYQLNTLHDEEPPSYLPPPPSSLPPSLPPPPTELPPPPPPKV